MSDDGDCCYPVWGYTQPDPQPFSALTREQYEKLVQHHTIGWGQHSKVNPLLDHDAAQRRTLAQQAQRIVELGDQWRKTNAQYESAAKAVTRQVQEIERLKKLIDSIHSSYNTVAEQANTIIKQRDELVFLQHRFDDAMEAIDKLQRRE